MLRRRKIDLLEDGGVRRPRVEAPGAEERERIRARDPHEAGVEILQGVVGYVQYFNGLPIAIVTLHMVGTTLFVAAITHLVRMVGAYPNSSGSSAAARAISAR